MYKLTIEDGELVVRPVGINRIRAARDQVRVPISKVRGVRIPREIPQHGPIFHHRVSEAEVPRPTMLGPMGQHTSSGQVPGTTLIIELDDHESDELVIKVHDPIAAAKLIRAAVANQT